MLASSACSLPRIARRTFPGDVSFIALTSHSFGVHRLALPRRRRWLGLPRNAVGSHRLVLRRRFMDSRGDEADPCLSPRQPFNSSDNSPSASCTLPRMPSWKIRTALTIPDGAPRRTSTSYWSVRSTESHALGGSSWHIIGGILLARPNSCS